MNLSSFDFEIKYKLGKLNPVDAPSWQPNYNLLVGLGLHDLLLTFQNKMKGSFIVNMMSLALQSRTSAKTIVSYVINTCMAVFSE